MRAEVVAAALRALPARLREKHFDRWLPGYLRDLGGRIGLGDRAPRYQGHRHVLFAFCDHYEPRWKHPSPEQALDRVRRWTEGYPRLAREFRDADGRGPRHSFFFPGEEYDPAYLEGLAELARAGHGEVELHLHHDNDTPQNLRAEITRYLGLYAQHGHLSRGPGGELKYAFIHGNWCLANARSDGRWCGVDAELPLLFETGCYADFTFPAVPDESQPGRVNQIYWPDGDLARRRAYEQGRRARVGESFDDRLLMIEGPLALVIRPRKRFLRIENADITGKTPGNAERVATWLRQDIHVEGRPEWLFVKVHTHGTQEQHADALLGAGARQLHQALAEVANDGSRYTLHYVTAREMFNVARAAMAGKTGNPADYFDYLLPPPPVARG